MFPPLGIGLGLRLPHYSTVMERPAPEVSWYEVISENFMVAGGNPRRVLTAVRERHPVVLHGVSLSIGSVDPLDETYLARLDELCRQIEPAMVSDHLCWSGLGGHSMHDLLPVPYTEQALTHVVERVAQVQDRLQRRILLENPSTYALFCDGEIFEGEFLAEVARRADCGILLDVNNVWVSCHNHGWDPARYLELIPADRVGQIHLAGHSVNGALLIDTHDAPVCAPVWALFAEAIQRLGPVSTCIERDDNIPPYDQLVEEVRQVKQVHHHG
jgi:uncharacterized protein (UPF0276 family)